MSLEGDERRAKVFISCGQSRQGGEREVAHRIGECLKGLGYEYYIAVEEQCLRGLTDNIFQHLATSEYLFFVDFGRELIGPENTDAEEPKSERRGSLFSHQELAIAAYLGLDVIALHECGVRSPEGMMRHLQVNSTPFTDRGNLHLLVDGLVREARWRPDWKRSLAVERDPEEYGDTREMNSGEELRYFHADVVNQHLWRPASNCYAQLRGVRHAGSRDTVYDHPCEVTWAGALLLNVAIGPRQRRDFDVVFVPHTQPNTARVQTAATSTQRMPRIVGPGQFDLCFAVISGTFPEVVATFNLTLGDSLDDARLAIADASVTPWPGHHR